MAVDVQTEILIEATCDGVAAYAVILIGLDKRESAATCWSGPAGPLRHGRHT
jgi:hypothetical protein